MTKEELIEKLRALNTGALDYDAEGAHAEADALLLQYIGDQRVTEAFDALEKWYA